MAMATCDRCDGPAVTKTFDLVDTLIKKKESYTKKDLPKYKRNCSNLLSKNL